MLASWSRLVAHSPALVPSALRSGRRAAGLDDAAGGAGGPLELRARPLRRDLSGIMAQLLMLAAVVLCPLLVVPWLWARRERFRLDRCRIRIDGATLFLYHRRRQLLALDLRYVTRQITGAGDLVLSESDAQYLALGIEPPEHGYPDPAELAERRSAAAHVAPSSAGFQLAAPNQVGSRPPPIRAWRAVRLAPADLQQLYAAVSAVPMRPLPESADVGALVQALGSVGATGRRVEGQLVELVRTDRAQARPSGLLTMLHERALGAGPPATAARRVLDSERRAPSAD